MLTKQDTEKLLGRSLSTKEDAAFEEYIDIAKEELEHLLGIRLDATTGAREYSARQGYRTLFVDPFTAIDSVTVDDDVVDEDDYKILHNERRSAPWYNSIVFDCRMGSKEVSVVATWGFGDDLPNDLKLLMARMFVVVSSEDVSGKDKVRSKSIEDFSVTYDTRQTPKEQFLVANARIIAKYQRPMGELGHGCI